MKSSNYFFIATALFVGASNSAIAFGSKNVVKDCVGVYPNSNVDSSSGLQECINASGSESAIYFPPGFYTIKKTITVSHNNVSLYSDSRSSAQLKFTGCGDLIKFSKVNTPMYNGSVKGLWLRGSGLCAQTALHFVDGSWFSVEDLEISNFKDSTQSSTGIQTNGREGFNVRNLRIEADNPVVIAKNPNHDYLDADHFHFENFYSSIGAGIFRWHISLKDPGNKPITVSNMTIDGQNSMTGGCGILKWVQESPAISVSSSLKIANVRHEQMTSGCDKEIDIQMKSALQSLIIDNVSFQGPFLPEGIAINVHLVDGMTVRNTSYYNDIAEKQKIPATFINATSTKYIQLENNGIYPFSRNIIAIDPLGAHLVWKSGPFTGKECCYVDPKDPSAAVRTPDSGILGQP